MRKKGVVSSTGKARVALEAFKGEHPFSAIAKRNSVHAIQVGKWRKKLIAEAYKVFDDSSGISQTEHEEEVRLLYEEIGRLKVENNFLKKNLVTSVRDRRELIDPDFGELSIRAQCAPLEVSRSSYYYEPLSESELNLALMRIIDALHLDYPFAGSRMMQGFLQQRGELVNRKRVQRLMRLMGIEAIFPAKSLSRASSHHIKFPYLLRGLAIQRCNQVWGADITYVPIVGGFLYLFAIIDWFSRYVVGWQLSNSLSNDFYLETVERAFSIHSLWRSPVPPVRATTADNC